MRSVITGEILRIDKLDRDEHDKRTADVVGGVRDLVGCTEMEIV